ncbi:DNA methyltransferase [Rathayibacter sp. AY1G1]|uniref:DNA methyltransferase n=1 Tax=unclassified Rathayibacter TaxID=2609250 RepID=UPI000CE82600|nr:MULTISPECIES: DNA methyltransferase [unclassified Rathayibacter]PPF25838.1 DNA methyltransferase [Rathayibacter sp. AY1F2]PPF69105.1 DNA methyltransferase [Rathayibacter sp. AY1E6]PPG08985.1 DNA methyltransferase [Rathayibacter sp. AY2B1]PPG13264.1 DNA methyltransferase [Rathayibacter sp. AY1C6]PPG50776.1 DNA methyltransferase [Rathayibacter sp. AY2B3]
MTILERVARDSVARNEYMTFRANAGVGRHGWLRLTPAYGVKVVRERLELLEPGSVVTDPFSGTGTTPLAAAEYGHLGQSVDVNPFLVWLGNAKTRDYQEDIEATLLGAVSDVVDTAQSFPARDRLWQPDIFRIERWWSPGSLHGLRTLRASIDTYNGDIRDLLEILLCRTLIASSSAAFNHQSMSFKDIAPGTRFKATDDDATIALFLAGAADLASSASSTLAGSAAVRLGDSRTGLADLEPADLVLTSPPYCNRMSYIRELRPYMYWTRYLDAPSDAGDLDWRAIGGTWGTATSKLASWAAEHPTPIDSQLLAVCENISRDGGKSGPVLAAYVHKYHYDMWLHFQAAAGHVKPGGSVSYIVGNSTFSGHEVPVQKWYADMLSALGYVDVTVQTIRKRNSNKALYEYDVSGRRPSFS